MIGNFFPPHSTENERKWSFEKLGHEVIPFQENQTTADQLKMKVDELDMLMYSHTHDPAYVIPGLRDVFTLYKTAHVPTVSCHLDRWAGLKREEDVGKEATWFTEHVFMADASPEAIKLYKEHGINWHWLKPGVVEKACYIGQPDYDRFPHEIVFVGSRGYHPEYPWRHQLIDWLKETYGNRFGHYGNDGLGVVRGDDLNTLYASAKVIVGDSCFAGTTSNYWSDRIPETTGRGGFLIHPEVEGCDHRGVVWFPAGNFDALKSAINHYLEDELDREALKEIGFNWTKSNRTYTQLAKEILDTVADSEKN